MEAAEKAWWDLVKKSRGNIWFGNRKKPIQIVAIAYHSIFFFKYDKCPVVGKCFILER
jgi:hypothetical protein